jgi:hypothetical protein
MNSRERQRQEREDFRLAREKTLQLLAESREFADPDKVVDTAGFWLERWKRERSPMRGRPKPQRKRGERLLLAQSAALAA